MPPFASDHSSFSLLLISTLVADALNTPDNQLRLLSLSE